MENVVLTIHLILAVLLTGVVLLQRSEGGGLRTRTVAGGTLELQPPGLTVEVAAFFADEG